MKNLLPYMAMAFLCFGCFGEPEKQNFLFIMSDDHCERAIGI